MTVPISTHTRVNTGVLAAREKQALIWIAHRLPRWVSSDHLTLLALVAMAGAGASFWAARRWPPALVLVVVSLALNWFGDSLDGTLARVRKHERPRYGFYVDHVLDIAGASLLFGGMSLSGFMSPVVGLAVLGAYLLVSAEVFLATAVHGTFRMSFLRVGPTELRIILSIGALMLFSHPIVRLFGYGPFLLFDVGGVVAVVGMLTAFVTSAIRTTLALYRAEPLPIVDDPAKAPSGLLPQSARESPLHQRRGGRGQKTLLSARARWLRFNLVGIMGFALQTTLLWLLVRSTGVPVAVAVTIGVVAAVSHNFLWHECFTWPGRPRSRRFERWLSFHLSTGLISVLTNVAVTTLIMTMTGLPIVPANAIAVVAASIANFWINDRMIFRPRTVSVP